VEKKRRKTIAFFYEHLMKKNGEDTYVPKKSSLSLKYKKKTDRQLYLQFSKILPSLRALNMLALPWKRALNS